MQLIYEQGQFGGNLEFYSTDQVSGVPTLINDPATPGLQSRRTTWPRAVVPDSAGDQAGGDKRGAYLEQSLILVAVSAGRKRNIHNGLRRDQPLHQWHQWDANIFPLDALVSRIIHNFG